MSELDLSTSLFFLIIPLILYFFKSIFHASFLPKSAGNLVPRSYPLIGSLLSIYANFDRFIQWTCDAVNSNPTKTITLRFPFGRVFVFTANPAVVRHILKTNFHLYPKGEFARTSAFDFLGNGIFNVEGESWKFQRQVSSPEFNTKSLRNFIEHVVDDELNHRLLPLLTTSAANKTTVLDFQDILERFAFDNICKIVFGYDPAYLAPSQLKAKLATAFEDAAKITASRMHSTLPFIWKIKRFLDIGSEKKLRIAAGLVKEFPIEVIKEKKQELELKSSLDSVDLLSRFLSSGLTDESFVVDIVVSFILAGKDSSSAALTWFFWLVFKHPRIENEILKEIKDKSENLVYHEVKDMVYTHAALCESMRLYPPVAIDAKEAAADDVLPDGTEVKKGYMIAYHIYAMGRSEELWGSDWAEFRPERWLEKDQVSGKWVFKARDAYEYPVFQAGPRVCLGKEMAFLQMKMVVAGVLRRFRVIPAAENGVNPVYICQFTAKMKGGFPVRIEERLETK